MNFPAIFVGDPHAARKSVFFVKCFAPLCADRIWISTQFAGAYSFLGLAVIVFSLLFDREADSPLPSFPPLFSPPKMTVLSGSTTISVPFVTLCFFPAGEGQELALTQWDSKTGTRYLERRGYQSRR